VNASQRRTTFSAPSSLDVWNWLNQRNVFSSFVCSRPAANFKATISGSPFGGCCGLEFLANQLSQRKLFTSLNVRCRSSHFQRTALWNTAYSTVFERVCEGILHPQAMQKACSPYVQQDRQECPRCQPFLYVLFHAARPDFIGWTPSVMGFQ
jgi:hypothetical protein